MSPQNIEYEGRHRDDSQIGRALFFQREYRFKWFGYEYTPRHAKRVAA